MDDDDALRPAEVARQRRRDRDASAAERAGMRAGLAKSMKQIMDAQARRAAEARRALEDGGAPGTRRGPRTGRTTAEDSTTAPVRRNRKPGDSGPDAGGSD